MKKNLITIYFITLAFISCGDFEPVVYDVNNGQSLVSFADNASSLPVTIDATGSVEIQINVNTFSSSARTVSIEVDESSTALPENYTVPSTATIPANSLTTTFTVMGTDNSVETTAETIVLNITSIDTGGVVSQTSHTVSIFQVCPVPSDYFTGMYLIEQVSAQVDGYSLSHNSIVEVVALDETTRSFATEAYISYCSGTFFDFQFNLVCNELIVPFQDTTCRCSSAVDWWGPAITPETYDLSDDSVIFLTFTDDAQSDCGTPAQTTYRFTKQ